MQSPSALPRKRASGSLFLKRTYIPTPDSWPKPWTHWWPIASLAHHGFLYFNLRFAEENIGSNPKPERPVLKGSNQGCFWLCWSLHAFLPLEMRRNWLWQPANQKYKETLQKPQPPRVEAKSKRPNAPGRCSKVEAKKCCASCGWLTNAAEKEETTCHKVQICSKGFIFI